MDSRKASVRSGVSKIGTEPIVHTRPGAEAASNPGVGRGGEVPRSLGSMMASMKAGQLIPDLGAAPQYSRTIDSIHK